jgi:hypothetical protein
MSLFPVYLLPFEIQEYIVLLLGDLELAMLINSKVVFFKIFVKKYFCHSFRVPVDYSLIDQSTTEKHLIIYDLERFQKYTAIECFVYNTSYLGSLKKMFVWIYNNFKTLNIKLWLHIACKLESRCVIYDIIDTNKSTVKIVMIAINYSIESSNFDLFKTLVEKYNYPLQYRNYCVQITALQSTNKKIIKYIQQHQQKHGHVIRKYIKPKNRYGYV